MTVGPACTPMQGFALQYEVTGPQQTAPPPEASTQARALQISQTLKMHASSRILSPPGQICHKHPISASSPHSPSHLCFLPICHTHFSLNLVRLVRPASTGESAAKPSDPMALSLQRLVWDFWVQFFEIPYLSFFFLPLCPKWPTA